jgi:phosphoribosylformimino-5-aminoimidazole carboxamide ribotide isomerase
MYLYPAIDLKGGQCVRLLRGDMGASTVFSDDPGAQASAFVGAGCERLHVVDLNGAFEGRPVNADAVRDILEAVAVPVQLGGGIRSHETIDHWIEAGIARVILGTIALKDPGLVIAACARHPGKIAVGIDARGGCVAVEGWTDVSEVKVLELAKRYEDTGVAAIIYTDIDRDGAMQGPNLEATKVLADAVSIPVIASGGVSSMDDLSALCGGIPNLDGVISGRAVYDGLIEVGEAIRLLKG